MSTARKELIWNIRGRMFTLSSTNLYELAKSIPEDTNDTTQFSQNDKESCMDYVTSYLQSDTLLQLEDEGMSQSLMLNDLVSQVIAVGTLADPPAEFETPNMPRPHPSNIMPDPPPPDSRPDLQTNTSIHSETQSIEELRRAYEELSE